MPPISKKPKKPIQDDSEEDEMKGESVVSAQLQKKLDRKAKDYKRPERGVVLVRHLPHGFFEDQIRNYFEQFGHVTRLRLARSRITGNAKGFAFVEFAVPEVAKVAAEAMDNYLMFKKIVHAHYIPPEEQKFNYFKTKLKQVTTPLGKNIYVSGQTKLARYKVKQNNKWTQFNYEKRTNNSIKKLNKLKKKYAELGLDFDDITIAPKLMPFKVIENDEAKKENDTEKEDETETVNTSQQSEDSQAGSLLLIKKRKRNSKQNEIAKIPKLTPTLANNKELKQLLNKTLDDESTSEDEDYAPNNSELKEMLSTDENGSDIIDSSDDDTNSEVESIDGNNTEEEDVLAVKKDFLKSKKADRLDTIIRRAPLLGGIQKRKNKTLKSQSTKPKCGNVAKDKLKNIAAKEIIGSNKMKKMKKTDLKKKKQK